jgi:hypothetical protein
VQPNRAGSPENRCVLQITAYKTTKAFPETIWKRFSLCVRASAGQPLLDRENRNARGVPQPDFPNGGRNNVGEQSVTPDIETCCSNDRSDELA